MGIDAERERKRERERGAKSLVLDDWDWVILSCTASFGDPLLCMRSFPSLSN